MNKLMLKFLLLAFAVVVLILLATKVIDTDTFQWDSGALAAFVAAFLVDFLP